MLRVFGIAVLSAALALVAPHTAAAQAQAANGNIEGTVRDSSGASLPGVMVTVTNMETGTTRSVVTNESGVYRAPLLPLGRYRVSAELQGFKTFEQQGITLSAGQTALINVELSVGNVSETITVSSESPIAQPGKIDLGRTIGEQEVRNLPLISRNPYNFAFLQANVTGYENNEFGVPRINANGSQMHTNYQLDGNTNTEKDRAGLRMLPISETLVREVKVITNGFAPEFGQTTGMVYNAITPSGTNDLRGSTSFRFRRNPMSARPFFLSPTALKPDTEVNDFNASLGGPVVRDKIHFFGAYQYVDRSLITGGQVITVDPAAAQTLGITLPSSGVIPAHQKVNFLFGKTDYQINTAIASRRATSSSRTRRLQHRRRTDDDGPGDGLHRSHGLRLSAARVEHRLLDVERAPRPVRPSPPVPHAGGLGSGWSRDYGQRRSQFRRPAHRRRELGRLRLQSGHLAGDRQHDLAAREAQLQGGHRRAVHRRRSRERRAFLYTFPNRAPYLAAKSGAAPLGYTNLQQDFGDLNVSYNSAFYGFFAQDDWQLSPTMKLLFGLRYDVFDVPSSRPFTANPFSNDFTIDKNNLAPRAGLSWSLDNQAKTVLRASTGLMFEPPLLDFYDNAIMNNGDPISYTATVAGTDPGAPAFPGSLASTPPGFALPRQNVMAVSPDFRTQSAWLTNVQIERAVRSDFAVAVGYVNSIGRNLPVLMDVNLLPSGATLADGRPIYTAAVSAATRVDPTFNHVNVFQSIGESTYNAFTATVTKRMTHGWQAQGTYTLARGVDTAPLTGTYVVGSGDDRVSDPSNLERDRGVTPFNQTHTFSLSTVISPSVSGTGIGPALLNHNQVGVILQSNGGLPFNIVSNRDLNLDGNNNDRPIGVERNLGRLGNVVVFDLRYSRFVPLVSAQRLELFFEAKNLFNRQNIAGVNRVVTTDTAGVPATALLTNASDYPDAGKSGYDQRLMQLGVKFIF